MTKISVDVAGLRRMDNWLTTSADDMPSWGKSLLDATADAPSYDGQYAPWLHALAGDADHDIRAFGQELSNLGRRLERIANGFEAADLAEKRGDYSCALIMRETLDRGEIPTSDWFKWRQVICRPPWISPAAWPHLDLQERKAVVLSAREVYDAQNERIARMRTPPWEKDEGWLLRIILIDPLANEGRRILYLDDIFDQGNYLQQYRARYDQLWSDFLKSQTVYKFGIGDDLSEGFLIYAFGFEGAIEYGATAIKSSTGDFIGVHVDEEQRLLKSSRDRLIIDGIVDKDRIAEYYNLNNIPRFKDKSYGSNRDKDKGVHYNLCGQIGTAATIDVYPVDALITFDSLPGGREILINEKMGTRCDDLESLFEAYGWETEQVGHAEDAYTWHDNRSWKPKYDQVEDHLKNGRAINALVNLDKISKLIEPVNRINDTGHWTPILQLMTTRDGEQLARLYNPFQDCEEWYPFDHLVQSWTPSANYVAVVATPPEELRWLPNP